MRISWDGDRDIDAGSDKCPEESGNALCVVRENLKREGQGVDVGAVVSDDREREDDQAELAKLAQMWD